jgi:hypothetical protein
MLAILLAGPGGNWIPLLIPIISLGAIIILGNALYLKWKRRHKNG